jgi:hypothetical protein
LKGFELIDREHEIKDVVGIFQQEWDIAWS